MMANIRGQLGGGGEKWESMTESMAEMPHREDAVQEEKPQGWGL